MIEHPVPQNITAYQFHLIGNMTIKQFLLLLVGMGLGFSFYSTNLPGIIKIPLMIVSVVLGIAMAFLPYEERTLDQWLINFIRAIYRPTKFYWRRTAPTPGFVTFQPRPDILAEANRPDLSPYRKQQVSEFLTSLHARQNPTPVGDPLDMFQSENAISSLFSTVEAADNVLPGKDLADTTRPNLKVSARPLGRREHKVVENTSVDIGGIIQQQAIPTPVPAPPQNIAFLEQNLTTAENVTTPITQEASVAPINLVETDTNNAQVTQEALQDSPITPVDQQTYTEASAPSSSLSNINAITPAIFDAKLPFPSIPTTPNMILGMVHDSKNAIVSNAIVEILTAEGSTVRAMKTNNLGQFYISTPLKAGSYTLETEKDGLKFPVYALTVNDTILDPIDIRAQAV